LLHFTGGIQRALLFASKQAQQLVKGRLTSILTVFSFELEIFRSLNVGFDAFPIQNTTRATFSFETLPAAGKTLPYVYFDRIFFPVGDISSFKRCFEYILRAEYNARLI
jgi:hypothetical protein